MITKNQWQQFCEYVYNARKLGMTPYMKGERVYQMDMENYEIKTINPERSILTNYSHNSLQPNQRLRFLSSLITFEKVSMDTMVKFLHYFNNTNVKQKASKIT